MSMCSVIHGQITPLYNHVQVRQLAMHWPKEVCTNQLIKILACYSLLINTLLICVPMFFPVYWSVQLCVWASFMYRTDRRKEYGCNDNHLVGDASEKVFATRECFPVTNILL